MTYVIFKAEEPGEVRNQFVTAESAGRSGRFSDNPKAALRFEKVRTAYEFAGLRNLMDWRVGKAP